MADPVLVLVGATVSFAVVASLVVAPARRSGHHPRGTTVLATMGAVWLAVVVLLWFDGRIGRYFTPALWAVVAVGPLVGAAVRTDRVGTATASAGWATVFAVAFAVRLPLGVPVGSAAVLGYAVETLTVAFVSVPGFLLGAAAGASAGRHLPDATDH